MLLYAFVLMGIPGHVMGIADWFGRDSRGWSSSAVSKILGIATLVIGILLVRGYLFG
jgi:hypothetical protein